MSRSRLLKTRYDPTLSQRGIQAGRRMWDGIRSPKGAVTVIAVPVHAVLLYCYTVIAVHVQRVRSHTRTRAGVWVCVGGVHVCETACVRTRARVGLCAHVHVRVSGWGCGLGGRVCLRAHRTYKHCSHRRHRMRQNSLLNRLLVVFVKKWLFLILALCKRLRRHECHTWRKRRISCSGGSPEGQRG